MTERRIDDPETFDAAAFRRDDPTLVLGYKNAKLSIRGIGVFLALAVAAIITSNLYAGFRLEQTFVAENKKVASALDELNGRHTGEHKYIVRAQDRTSCIITMDQADRAKFRDRYQPGAFKQMCPWIDE